MPAHGNTIVSIANIGGLEDDIPKLSIYIHKSLFRYKVAIMLDLNETMFKLDLCLCSHMLTYRLPHA